MNLHRIPQLLITPAAWRKMLTYVQLCPEEINGWAYVRQIDSSHLYIGSADDVFITDQVVSGGQADNSESTMGMAQYRAAFVDDRGDQLKLQWHSHVKGQSIFSTTDTGTMDGYEAGGANWMASLVLNKYGQASGRLDLYTPLRTSIDLRVYLEQEVDNALVKECAANMLDHVQVRKYFSHGKGKDARHWCTDIALDEHALTRFDVAPHHLTLTPIN